MDEFISDIKRTFSNNIQAEYSEVPDQLFYTIFFMERSFAIQFISLDRKKLSGLDPKYFQETIKQYNSRSIRLINIWEDQWWNKKEIILSRIASMLGNTRRIFARQTIVKRIDKKQSEEFLNTHHLMGYANAKYKYGLFYKNELVAVASFSGGRTMTRTETQHRSYELIHFANAIGVTVTGGLSKLLKAFIEEVNPDDIMTYAECDWSDGNSYTKLGFKIKEITPPQLFWISEKEKVRYSPHRLPENFDEKKYFRIYNSGNLKLIKKLMANSY